MTEETAPLAGHVEAHVDGFLDVAAGLGKHLPHLARHQQRELVLLIDQQLPEAKENLAAPGRGHEPPLLVGGLRGGDRTIDVLAPGARKDPDQLARSRADRLEGLAARSVDPFAVDVVLEGLRLGDRHGAESSERPALLLGRGVGIREGARNARTAPVADLALAPV